LFFLYFEEPDVIAIDPICGPTYGQTQITVTGKNFVDLGFGVAKCVFNNTRRTNVTIIDDSTLLCSSPALFNFEASLVPRDMVFHLAVTMDGKTTTQHYATFAYYNDPQIFAVRNSNVGPVNGNTLSILGGIGFTHPNICNMKVRYGALEVSPRINNDTSMNTTSPKVKVTGAVVLSASGNGQNYAKDKTLHYRDPENTFTYY